MKFNANNNRTVRITKYERFNLISAQNNLISECYFMSISTQFNLKDYDKLNYFTLV